MDKTELTQTSGNGTAGVSLYINNNGISLFILVAEIKTPVALKSDLDIPMEIAITIGFEYSMEFFFMIIKYSRNNFICFIHAFFPNSLKTCLSREDKSTTQYIAPTVKNMHYLQQKQVNFIIHYLPT